MTIMQHWHCDHALLAAWGLYRGDRRPAIGSSDTATLREDNDAAGTIFTHISMFRWSLWASVGGCWGFPPAGGKCLPSTLWFPSALIPAPAASNWFQRTEWPWIVSSLRHARFNCMWSINIHFRVTLIYCHLRKTMYRREPIKVQSACIGEQMELYM